MKFARETFGSECFESFSRCVPGRGNNDVVCFGELQQRGGKPHARMLERRMKRVTNQLLSKGETKASRRAGDEVGRHSGL